MYFRGTDLVKLALRAVASLVIVAALSLLSTNSQAADLPSGDGYAYVTPVAVAPSGWQFRFTPYAWAPSVVGDATIRGRTIDIDASFWDIFDSGSSKVELDSLAALMGYLEAQKGPWGIYGDVVWGKFDFSGDAVAQRNPIAAAKVSARANAGLNYEMTMAESGLTYQVAKWGGPYSSTAFDVLAGARYWNQQLDLSLAVDGSVDLGNLGLKRSGSVAVARSGTLEWVDPFVGLRVRQSVGSREGTRIPRRCRRLWCRQRFYLAAIRRLQLRFLGLADRAAWPGGLSRARHRLHARRSKQEQSRPHPARTRDWPELPLVAG